MSDFFKRRSFMRAFTMVEVIVASMILMFTILAVFSTIARTRQPMVDSDKKLQAVIYGKRVLDALRGQISSDTVSSGNFTEGAHNVADVLAPPTGLSGTYNVVSSEGAKKVTVDVDY